MWVAIRIYSHVGYEFRVFGQERDRSSSTDMSAQSSAERGAVEKAVREHRSQLRSNEKMNDDIAPDDSSMPGPMLTHPHPDDIGSPAHVGRRMSLPAWHSPFGPNADMSTTPTARSNPTSRRGSRQIAPGVLAEDFMAPPGFDFTRPRGSVSTITSSIDQRRFRRPESSAHRRRSRQRLGSQHDTYRHRSSCPAPAAPRHPAPITHPLHLPSNLHGNVANPLRRPLHELQRLLRPKPHFPTLTALLVLPNFHGIRRRERILLARAALATHTR
jgi:hypothetical protein